MTAALVALVLGVSPFAMGAQDFTLASSSRAPRFLYAGDAGETPYAIDIASVPSLARRITVDLVGMERRDALARIARQSGLQLVYAKGVVAPEGRVALRAEQISVAAALTEVLFDTGVDVVMSLGNTAILVRREVPRAPRVGIVTGRVRDSSTTQGIGGVTVAVEGTRISTLTGSDGAFRLANVPAGEQRITARRIGYGRGFHNVMVSDSAEATVEFVLAQTPTRLTQVVTTATGDRERLEVGNAIGTIQADSIVPTTLIRNMSDLLQARTPGVVVQNTSGQVGSPSRVRVRGVNSMTLNNDPIVIVDGVRMSSQTTFASSQLNSGGPALPGSLGGSTQIKLQVRPSPLDDLDPNSIESIDVLRGPSAASLYGTEAANGVIVVKTKRGRPGNWRTNLMMDQGRSVPAGRWPDQWFGWGRTADRGTSTFCMLASPLTHNNVEAGSCMLDSATHFHPQNIADMRTLGTGTTQNVNAQISGGAEQIRQRFSFGWTDDVGMATMSPAQERYIAQLWRSPAPSWMVRPNTAKHLTGSSNTALSIGRKAELLVTASGSYRDVLDGGAGLPNFSNSGLNPTSKNDTLAFLPGETQRPRQGTKSKNGVVSANLVVTPMNWLTLRGTVGGNYSVENREFLVRASDCTEFLEILWRGQRCRGSRITTDGERFVATVDAGATFSFDPLPWLNTRTSIGENYKSERFNGLSAGNGFNTDLAFGSELLSPNPIPVTGAPQLFDVTETRDQLATAGWYIEQTAGIRERLFLNVALRQDAASAFGDNVNAKAPTYPKGSISWVISNESFFQRQHLVTAARMRAAYGHSGQQASQTNVLNNYILQQAVVNGSLANGIAISRMGNPDLRPERAREWEGGVDLSFLDNERVKVELTMYHKTTEDAVINITLPPSYGVGRYLDFNGFIPSLTQSVNVGSVENRGAEASVTAFLVDRPLINWEATVNWSRNRNRLVKKDPRLNSTGPQNSEFREGYPLYGYWGFPVISYADANNDGILGVKEMSFGNRVFMGAPYPKEEFTIFNTVALWRGLLHLQANVYRTSGLANRFVPGNQGISRGNVDPTAPLAMQAAAIQSLLNNGFLSEASTWRFGELSGTYNVPARYLGLLRARSAAITLAARNIAYWTDYAGMDPNVDTSGQLGEATRDGGDGVPQPRQWTIRFNVGF